MVVYGKPTGRVGRPIYVLYNTWRLLEPYWREHPDRLAADGAETGTDPLNDPDGYFRIELTEPQHEDVKAMVLKHSGIFGPEAFRRWRAEEDQEPDHQPGARSLTGARGTRYEPCPGCSSGDTNFAGGPNPLRASCSTCGGRGHIETPAAPEAGQFASIPLAALPFIHEREEEYRYRRPTSICPLCRQEFIDTGQTSGICSRCIHRRGTWAAPPRAGAEFYP